MMMINKWLDRVDLELFLQKRTQEELVTMKFTRSDLIELRMIIGTLKDMTELEKKNEQTN